MKEILIAWGLYLIMFIGMVFVQDTTKYGSAMFALSCILLISTFAIVTEYLGDKE